jgi:hypothetical protein
LISDRWRPSTAPAPTVNKSAHANNHFMVILIQRENNFLGAVVYREFAVCKLLKTVVVTVLDQPID